MQFARLATITTTKTPIGAPDWVLAADDFQVGCVFNKQSENNHLRMVAATTRLKYLPKKTSAGFIVIEDSIREKAENAIEHMANLIAVSSFSSRKVSSTNPCVCLRAESENEKDFLSTSKGIYSKSVERSIVSSLFHIDLSLELDYLRDRLDGVAIIAELLEYSQASGQFREAIRLFERAFGESGRALIGPLSLFMKTGVGSYTVSEIEKWMDVRDGITHADKRNQILFEADVSWFAQRLTQASYDVLLNKTKWRSSDAERRNVWTAECGSDGAEGGLFGVSGAEWNIKLQFFDEYRRFPLNLEGNLPSLPDGWWAGGPPNQAPG